MSSRPVEPINICVIVPTYNNKLTIAGIIGNAAKIIPDVIVVDDGSTDGASQLLDQLDRISVVRHEHNRGKGVALADGFAFAAQQGYSHAISMDGDGQHLAANLPGFVQAIENSPTALIIGRRRLSGGGKRLKSRILRAHSNFWVWLLTGNWVRDSQGGFRAYPLAWLQGMRVQTSRYDYEVEVLVKGLWVGLPVREIPVEVDYVPGSKSHFRPLVDFMRVFRLICSLLVKRVFMPLPLLKLRCLKAPRGGPRNPRLAESWPEVSTSLQFSAAVGVFWGLSPAWGGHQAAARATARHLGLDEALSARFARLACPAAIPLIVYSGWSMGHFFLQDFVQSAWTLGGGGLLYQTSVYALEYLVGGFILAATGSAATSVAFAAVRLFRGLGWRSS